MVKEIVVDVTPEDMDGQLLYKMVFKHKFRPGIGVSPEVTELYISKTSRNTPVDFLLVDDKDTTFKIKSAFSARDTDKNIQRELPVFDVWQGTLKVAVKNNGIFESIKLI